MNFVELCESLLFAFGPVTEDKSLNAGLMLGKKQGRLSLI